MGVGAKVLSSPKPFWDSEAARVADHIHCVKFLHSPEQGGCIKTMSEWFLARASPHGLVPVGLGPNWTSLAAVTEPGLHCFTANMDRVLLQDILSWIFSQERVERAFPSLLPLHSLLLPQDTLQFCWYIIWTKAVAITPQVIGISGFYPKNSLAFQITAVLYLISHFPRVKDVGLEQ